ncbi:MAG: hypothetical protein M3Q06_00315 [Bacteroidota bacterium]|nr:hypothetical protein [Bacteroidota bacterium]
MKKVATQLLYVFSFTLLFTALYLNFIPKEKESSFLHKGKEVSPAALTESNAVAQPQNTVLK